MNVEMVTEDASNFASMNLVFLDVPVEVGTSKT